MSLAPPSKLLHLPHSAAPYLLQVNTIAWNSSGSRLVSGADDRHLKIYDANMGLVSMPVMFIKFFFLGPSTSPYLSSSLAVVLVIRMLRAL